MNVADNTDWLNTQYWLESTSSSMKLIRKVVESDFFKNSEIILNHFPSSEILDWMDESLGEYLIMPNEIRIRYGGPPMHSSTTIFGGELESDYRIDGQKLIFDNEKDMTLFIIKYGGE